MLRNARGGGGCVTQRYVALQGGGGVLVLVLRNACIYFKIMLLYSVDLPHYKTWVQASQHLKVIRNGVCCYNNSCLPF